MSTHLIGDNTDSDDKHARAKLLHQAGMIAYKNGERTKAHLLWQQSVHLNPKNQSVWFALYEVATNDADRITCLENALRLNAKNPRIPERLKDLQRRQRIIKGLPAPAEPPLPHQRWRLWGIGLTIALMLGLIGLLLHFQIIP